ncbi:uncharacterized protein EV154DRAFT_239975 [Mucor mucedo]|uniref:uncharacterized protein n=1 Tax=Mucor mucedo TaxID=29922 RepID=UPI00221F66C9|nr:uncharacterized protein EV154DRAFT_239975 [Mucor mucedo]KAI7896461.1 hypothetical protein EV154DRAFT_239975 [Mucor mucedo]
MFTPPACTKYEGTRLGGHTIRTLLPISFLFPFSPKKWEIRNARVFLTKTLPTTKERQTRLRKLITSRYHFITLFLQAVVMIVVLPSSALPVMPSLVNHHSPKKGSQTQPFFKKKRKSILEDFKALVIGRNRFDNRYPPKGKKPLWVRYAQKGRKPQTGQ